MPNLAHWLMHHQLIQCSIVTFTWFALKNCSILRINSFIAVLIKFQQHSSCKAHNTSNWCPIRSSTINTCTICTYYAIHVCIASSNVHSLTKEMMTVCWTKQSKSVNNTNPHIFLNILETTTNSTVHFYN